jgi:hypothetical protein
MQNGGSTESWQLRGTLKFRFGEGFGGLLNGSLEGFGTPNVADNNVFLMRGPGRSTGTFDEQTGAINTVLPFSFVRPGQPDSMLKMNFVGTLADRVLTGTAESVFGSTTAHVDIFCREQFLDALVAIDYQFDEDGNISLGNAQIAKGTPAISPVRNGLTSGDVLFETKTGTGVILDQFVVKKPVPARDRSVAGITFSLFIPLSNGIETILVRDGSGQIVTEKNLSGEIAAFCAGDGSQYCDLTSGKPIRKVFFTPNSPPPTLLLPSTTSGNYDVAAPLPSSSRVFQGELTVASTTDDRQPSVALDADGNAVVAWRHGYKEIMVKGIGTDNSVKFGPTVVNDKFCAMVWVPKPPTTPVPVKEYATLYTTRPLVAQVGGSDGTFVVGWGGFVDIGGVGSPVICARFFNGNGSPLTDPILVGPTSNAPVDDLTSYMSLSISNSHKAIFVWHGLVSSSYKTFARLVDPDQTNLPAPISVGSDSSAHSIYPTVAMAKNGQAVITWLKTSSLSSGPNGLSGSLMFQRFDSDFTKRGEVMSGGPINGIPSVAWSSASNTFLLASRRSADQIWASTYAFDTGGLKGDWFQANARWTGIGRQHRPVLVPGAKGEFTVAWMDDVTLGSKTGSVVTAQVFRSDFVPEDIDFTISTQNPIDVENLPDLLDMDGFGFSAGGSGGDNMAFVWQKAEGIAFQRVSGGAYTCPEPEDCKTAVPWRITGPTKDKLDVLLTRGEWHNPRGGVENPFSGELEFSRKAVVAVVNGLFVNDVIRQNAGKLNFYRGTEPGGAEDNYTCDPTSPYNSPRSAYPFLDVTGLLTKGPRGMISADGCGPDSRFGVNMGDLWDPQIMSMITHEFSHSAFYLSDEYDCADGTATKRKEREAPDVPNMYTSMVNCQNRSAHPNDCRVLPQCAEKGESWYRADKDDPVNDLMGPSHEAYQYKEDCQRNPTRIFGGLN